MSVNARCTGQVLRHVGSGLKGSSSRGGEAMGRSFDCATGDEAASRFAQDDGSVEGQMMAAAV
jgi:hypothetical protein